MKPKASDWYKKIWTLDIKNRKLGCIEAIEINQVIAENEPYDVQMEFVL